jgi:hypothetical protein
MDHAGNARRCWDEGAERFDTDAIEERAGLTADGVPAVYLEACSRLNCQKLASVSKAESRLALRDGGCFLDEWGSRPAELGSPAGTARYGQPAALTCAPTSAQKYFDSILE